MLSSETISILSKLICHFEGCKLQAYKCPAGVWTIGYGQTGPNIKAGTVWTQSQADEELKKAMQKYWAEALKWSPNLAQASPSRQAAIIDFCYNCGIGNYQISSLLKSVNSRNWKQASQDILKWNKARVNGELKVLRGLVLRREAESKLLLAD